MNNHNTTAARRILENPKFATLATYFGGIDSLGSIPGLLKSLQIQAQIRNMDRVKGSSGDTISKGHNIQGIHSPCKNIRDNLVRTD
ncbi:MAG: hypothetical protein ACK56F_08605 [bacterium]